MSSVRVIMGLIVGLGIALTIWGGVMVAIEAGKQLSDRPVAFGAVMAVVAVLVLSVVWVVGVYIVNEWVEWHRRDTQ